MPTEHDKEQKAPAKTRSVKAWIRKSGRLKVWIIGLGAVAGALTTVLALVFELFPEWKPIAPPEKAEVSLNISRVDAGVTRREFVQLPGVPIEAVEYVDALSEEERERVGSVVYFDVTLTGFARKPLYVRWSVYDANTRKPVANLTNTSAWPADILRPRSQASSAEYETWVPTPEDGHGAYVVRLEVYSVIDGQESRLDSAEKELKE